MKESKTLIIGLVVFIFLVLVVSGSYFSGRAVLLAEVVEPNDVYAKKIYADPSSQWVFQGTYCIGCNFLYNLYGKYPKICDKCGEQTKDYYYLVLIKDR